MKPIIILIAILLISASRPQAQTRTIYGCVIAEMDMDPIPGVLIRNAENVTLGLTDKEGRFRIGISENDHKLTFLYLGFEPANIFLTKDCDTIELVMMDRPFYDFRSSRKIDRLRLASFKNLADVYTKAYQKGLFNRPAPCYTREFKPEKPALDSIQRVDDEKARQVKQTFKQLKIGDTVRIPFYFPYGTRYADTARLSYCIFISSANNYDYIVRVVILGKNRHKRRYNLTVKITGCELCNQPATLQGWPMKPGEVFNYNMRSFKVLTK